MGNIQLNFNLYLQAYHFYSNFILRIFCVLSNSEKIIANSLIMQMNRGWSLLKWLTRDYYSQPSCLSPRPMVRLQMGRAESVNAGSQWWFSLSRYITQFGFAPHTPSCLWARKQHLPINVDLRCPSLHEVFSEAPTIKLELFLLPSSSYPFCAPNYLVYPVSPSIGQHPLQLHEGCGGIAIKEHDPLSWAGQQTPTPPQQRDWSSISLFLE